jgi:hypothetical protein
MTALSLSRPVLSTDSLGLRQELRLRRIMVRLQSTASSQHVGQGANTLRTSVPRRREKALIINSPRKNIINGCQLTRFLVKMAGFCAENWHDRVRFGPKCISFALQLTIKC